MMDSACYWPWLAAALGYGAGGAAGLLEVYGTAQAVYESRFTEDLSPFLQPAQLARLQALEPEEFEGTLRACRAKGIQMLPLGSPCYPAAFMNMPDAPVVLYCTGEPAALSGGPYVGMVGSRRPSPYGVQAAAALGDALAGAGAVLVSGLADGLDGEAHRAAVRRHMPTVAVLGCAIDRTYPACNAPLRRQIEREGGVTVSEYGPGTASTPNYFLLRNRLIAALSDALLVVEARLKSGTMSTVRHAERYGCPVYAVPGSIFSPVSEGANALLAGGRAQAATCARDILGPLGLEEKDETRAVEPAALSAAAQKVLALIGARAQSLEELKCASDLDAGAVLAALTELELAGRVSALAGRRYQLRQ